MIIFVLIVLEVIGFGTIIAELYAGIAVTGWQGEKPYVLRREQPGLFAFSIAVQLLALALPWIIYAVL